MSNEARRKCGDSGVWFSLCIRSMEFVMLKALGRGLGGLLSVCIVGRVYTLGHCASSLLGGSAGLVYVVLLGL